MRPPMARGSRDDRFIAGVVTICFHAVLGGLMYAAGELVERKPRPAQPIEMEIVHTPPRRTPPPKVEKKVEPKVEEKVEKQDEPKVTKVERKVTKQARPRRVQRDLPTPVTEQPASGPSTNDDAPAPVISLPNLGASGSGPPVAVGRPKTRLVGTGGTGTNTGGGGAADSQGTGGPRPVSIASIKKRARPLNPDLDTSKLYPDEARRLGIEGQVKVYLVVDETGRVVRRRVTKSLGHGLDQVALELAKKLRFEPAIDTEGRPVSDKLEWTFTFVLPR